MENILFRLCFPNIFTLLEWKYYVMTFYLLRIIWNEFEFMGILWVCNGRRRISQLCSPVIIHNLFSFFLSTQTTIWNTHGGFYQLMMEISMFSVHQCAAAGKETGGTISVLIVGISVRGMCPIAARVWHWDIFFVLCWCHVDYVGTAVSIVLARR